jgi:serine/threonine protein kinase/Tol biopolymer transport system component
LHDRLSYPENLAIIGRAADVVSPYWKRIVSLAPGTRLGPYEIVAPLGSGGMGEVYTARDTRLDRRVAVKLSKEQFSTRFEREARAVAALNHPNICQLYDVGPNYLVMEYVDGVPLATVADTRQLLDVGIQIADALASAHAAGIVHRDLKPSNIVIAPTGQVKILDFGLALVSAVSIEASGVTREALVTAAGATIGTPAYMSPEQARGLTVDARTDLWSLGVVLYELATGVRPFEGATSAVVFEELLGKTPPAARTRNPKVPLDLDRVISRLLEKDRETRYQSAADVRADLKRIARDNADGTVAGTPQITAAPASGRRSLALAAGVAAIALVAVVVWVVTRSAGGPVTSPTEYIQLTNFADSVTDPSLSADGRMVTFIRGDSAAFPRVGDIYVKLLPNGEAVRLTNSPGRKYGPVFTPDGSRVAYTVRGTTWDTWTVPIAGGEPTRMLPNASGLHWIDDQHVLFAEIKGTGLHMGIVTATTSRSDKREIYYPDHERAMAHYAYRSPDLRSLLVVEMDRVQDFQPCRLVPFDGSSPGRQVGPSGSCTAAAWSPDGNWMYFIVDQRGRSRLWRQRYPDGQPEQITFGPTDETGLAIAGDGRSIVTAVGQERGAIWMHDDRGDRQVTTEGVASSPRLSSDGKRLYYLVRPNALDSRTELRSLELASGRTDRLLPDRSITQFAISPDEHEAAFTTTTPAGIREIWIAPLDRTTPPVRVVESGDEVSFGPGSELIFRALENRVNFLTSIRRDGTGRRRILETPILNKFGVSPDGKWATALAPGGDGGTFVTLAVPLDGGIPRPVCAGCAVNWSNDGKWLYVGPEGAVSPTTVIVPTSEGEAPPDSLAEILQSVTKGQSPPGTRLIEKSLVVPGPDLSTYAFTRRDVQRNLFRIPLH